MIGASTHEAHAVRPADRSRSDFERDIAQSGSVPVAGLRLGVHVVSLPGRREYALLSP